MGKLVSPAERIALTAENIAADNRSGYSQPNRLGDGTTVTVTYPDGRTATRHGGDYDCSSMVCQCCICAGLLPKGSNMWTAIQDGVLRSAGFTRHVFAFSTVRRGDILWVKGHTGVALGGGRQADAHGDEVGGLSGPRKGDQTGAEIEVRSLRGYWTYVYRWEGADPYPDPEPKPEPEPVALPEQVAGKARNDVGLNYRAHCQDVGWLDPVRDGQTAGTEGHSLRMEAIKITPPEGVVLDVCAHLAGLGDTWYRGIRRGESSGTGTSDTDPIIGTVGESRRLEGVEVDVVEWPKSLAGRWLYYQLHLQGTGWTDVARAGEFCGTRGESRRAEAVRMWVE